jgi:hypothetical protein
MAIATQRFTLDEYLAYDDGRDGRRVRMIGRSGRNTVC